MDPNKSTKQKPSNSGMHKIKRKSNFAKLNTDELFKAVDEDNSGTISEDEWLNFWNTVKKSGHTEEEISEEVSNKLLVGKHRTRVQLGQIR